MQSDFLLLRTPLLAWVSLVLLVLSTFAIIHLSHLQVPAYGSVILIIRNPYRALIAEWNRLNAATHMAHTNGSNKHIGSTGQEQFGKMK